MTPIERKMVELTIELQYLIGAIRKLRRSLVLCTFGFSIAMICICVIALCR